MSCIEISVLKKKGNIEKQFTFVTIEDPSKNLEWSYFEKKKKVIKQCWIQVDYWR